MQDFDGPSMIVQQTLHLTGLMPAETTWRSESELREVVLCDFQPPFEAGQIFHIVNRAQVDFRIANFEIGQRRIVGVIARFFGLTIGHPPSVP